MMEQPETIQKVDVTSLERELRDLWKQMAAKSQTEGEQAVTRACVHNLAVYAPGESSESQLGRLLSDMMIEQPGRVILMLTDYNTSRDTRTGWVNAQCHRTAGHRQQVCSEQITIRAGRDELRNLPSLVIPLLVPDVPVFFWWREDLTSDWNLFEEVLENSDRVIVDSALFAEPRESLRRLSGIIKANQGVASFSDLNFNRLTPWRQMIAEFFDHMTCKRMLGSISTIDIQAHSHAEISAQSLMLISWLAARLKWKPMTRGASLLYTNQDGRQVNVRLFTRPPVKNQGRGLTSVTLRSENPAFTFYLAMDPETRYLRGTVEMKGTRPADRTIRLSGTLEEESVRRELEILGTDRIYEEMMTLLERIL